MQSKERFSSISTTTCWMSAMSVVHFLKLEADVARTADAHQRQQGPVELRHRQIAIDGVQKDRAQGARPEDDLKPMHRGAVDIRRDVLEPALADERQCLLVVGAQYAVAVIDLDLQLRPAALHGQLLHGV